MTVGDRVDDVIDIDAAATATAAAGEVKDAENKSIICAVDKFNMQNSVGGERRDQSVILADSDDGDGGKMLFHHEFPTNGHIAAGRQDRIDVGDAADVGEGIQRKITIVEAHGYDGATLS